MGDDSQGPPSKSSRCPCTKEPVSQFAQRCLGIILQIQMEPHEGDIYPEPSDGSKRLTRAKNSQLGAHFPLGGTFLALRSSSARTD